MRRLLAGLAAGALLLTGCSVDVRDEIRGTVEDITIDANARDVGAVRGGVDDLLRLLERAVREGDMTAEEAASIAALAARIRDSAELLEVTPEPTPSATSASPTPSPTPSATPSPTPSATPSPTPTQEPTPTPTPEETDPPVLPEPSLSPAAQEAPASPSATPAATP